MLARRLMLFVAVLAPALILSAGGAVPMAQAQEVPALEQCEARFDACVTACEKKNLDSSAGLAGCQARCAANRAACEAQAGYEQAKPWVQEQFERMEDFFEGFRDGPQDAPPAVPERENGDAGAGAGKDI